MVANAGVAINRVLHESTSVRFLYCSPGTVELSTPVGLPLAAPTEEVDRLIGINLKGVFFSYKYAAIQLIEQGTGGRIVGAASIASKQGELGRPPSHSRSCSDPGPPSGS